MPDVPAILATAPIEPQAHRVRKIDSGQVVEAIRIWPCPGCWRRDEAGWCERSTDLHVRWAEQTPEDDELPGQDAIGWNAPLRPLFELVPEDVRRVLMVQDDGVCWEALRLVHDVPELIDVARDIPSLAGLLAIHIERAEERDEACAELRHRLRGPRKRLLPLVELPARNSLLRTLAKLDPRALSNPGPHRVLQVLNSTDPDVVKLLRHLPRLRPDVMTVLRRPGLLWHASYALLADPAEGFFLHTYLEHIYLARRDGRAALTPARFTSRQQVLDFHAAMGGASAMTWEPDMYREFETPTDDVVLDGAPTLGLHAVTSPREMRDVALQDGLCIASDRRFPERAQEGVGAMYRCSWAARGRDRTATIWMSLFLVHDAWSIDQVRMEQNGTPPEWLLARLIPWIDRINAVRPGPPIEPIRGPTPPRQASLPLRFEHSPLDTPTAAEHAPALDRALAYEDRWSAPPSTTLFHPTWAR